MAWASTPKVVLGCAAFLAFWILAVFPAVPVLPIGRTAGSLLGATLMVVFQVISPREAFDAIDLPILGLLFGTMVVSVYLERADLFKYLGSALSWKSRGPKDLLCRICLLSAISSALFTNDTTCVLFTGFILKLCKEHNVSVLPFLMALATSSNIGSAATAIGNPQNLVIAVQSKISFFKFLVGVLPAMAVGILVNTILLLLFYWKSLAPIPRDNNWSNSKRIENGANAFKAEYDAEEPPVKSRQPDEQQQQQQHEQQSQHQQQQREPVDDVRNIASSINGRVLPVTFTPPQYSQSSTDGVTAGRHLSSEELPDVVNHIHQSGPVVIEDILHLRQASFSTSRREAVLPISRSCSMDRTSVSVEEVVAMKKRRSLRRRVWKICVYLVTLGMLAALLYGLNLSWSALTAAVALIVLDFSDAGPCLDQVSYALLVFFSGMFITVDGFNRTGAPGELWKSVEPHARIDSTAGIALLSLVVVLLSNVASNVPTVLLLGARVAASAAATKGASVDKSWLMLAWVSTVAGNLTLVGSAANLIVSEQARREESGKFNLSFWKHLKFGVPSTLIVIAVGLPLIQG